MSDDDEFDRWIRQVVAAAGRDAPTDEPAQLSSGTGSARASGPRRRWPVTLAAAVVALFGVGAVTWALTRPTDDVGTPTATDATPSTDATPATIPPASTDTAPAPTTATTQAPTTSTLPDAPTTVPAASLTHPIIELDGCQPTWALDGDETTLHGIYFYGFTDGLLLQLITPRGEPVGGRFAVAVHVANPRSNPANANTEVNGVPAWAQFATPTWGGLLWRLADGTEAYLRTSTMTQDELVALAAALDPRSGERGGFELSDGPYDIVDEAITPFTIGPVTSSGCSFDDGGWLRAAVFDGRLLGHALYLTDRAEGAAAAEQLDDGRVLVVTGRSDVEDLSDEALATVRDATPGEWERLTAADRDDYEWTGPSAPITTP